MNRKSILEALADEREALVADLACLSAADWDRPSLCEGWTVRDVVGHLLRVEASYRYGAPFVLGVLRHGFRINAYIANDARKRARDASSEALVTDLAATRYETTIGARFHPFPAIPLGEWIIHGQDIRRRLGLDRTFPVERLEAVADVLSRRVGYPWGRGRRRRRRFEATDSQWQTGDGEVVRAPLESIVMALAGRRVD